MQVIPGGEELTSNKGYRLRFDGQICVKLPSNVYGPLLFFPAKSFSANVYCLLQIRGDVRGVGLRKLRTKAVQVQRRRRACDFATNMHVFRVLDCSKDVFVVHLTLKPDESGM
jgi:hypothetical protein